jgi:hypothetical protein
MPFADLLGHTATLTVRKITPSGVLLARDENPRTPLLLLPGSELVESPSIAEPMEVFVCLDSEARPIATLHTPLVELGQVAFLEITAVTDIGGFAAWGPPKELLVPFSRQTRALKVGERHPIGLYLDNTRRFAGTMRVAEMLRDKGEFEQDEWVEGEAWRHDPDIGTFIIVERSFVGLVPAGEPHKLSRGDAGRFRVSNVLPDGRIELSLRAHAHEELANDAERILAMLTADRTLKVGERSSPEQIRDVFGLSKKAFKRAAGAMLKRGVVKLDADGFLVPKKS